MSGGTTRKGIRKEGISVEGFPTLNHPPEDILMGRKYPEKPGVQHDHPIKPSFAWVRDSGLVVRDNGLNVRPGELYL